MPLTAQMSRYLVVGGAAFLVDLSFFLLLIAAGLPVLLASATGFVIATLVNYVLCYTFVFTRGHYGRAGELTRLFMVALTGLVLNTLCVWVFITLMPLLPVLAKAAAVPFVFAWNYFGRRLFVFPATTPAMSTVRSR
jgi:putative flippase GtrA